MASHIPNSISPEQLRQEADEIRERGRVRINQLQNEIDHAASIREAAALCIEERMVYDG